MSDALCPACGARLRFILDWRPFCPDCTARAADDCDFDPQQVNDG